MEGAIALLWSRFQTQVLGHVDTLEQAAQAWRVGTLREELRKQAKRNAHKLAGSLGTFGFPAGSQLARSIESLLSAEQCDGDGVRLSSLITALREEVLRQKPCGELNKGEATGTGHEPHFLVVGAEPEAAAALLRQARARDLLVQVVADLDEARQWIARKAVEVVLLFTDLAEADLDWISALQGSEPSIAVLVLTERRSFDDRLKVARAGGRGFLPRTMQAGEVIELAVRAMSSRRVADDKVLVVDDDPQLLALVQTLLTPHGIEVVPLEDPRRFWEVLHETSPDLVILDMDMPHILGIELCQVLHSDPVYRKLPVLFLTAYDHKGVSKAVYAQGAVDFLAKPIVAEELLTHVVNHLERARLMKDLSETDPLTGLPSRRKSSESLNRSLHLAKRQHQPLCLVIVSVDDWKAIIDRYGHEAGDGLLGRLAGILSRSFRAEDEVARWGGETFVLGMYGAARIDAVRRISALVKALRSEEFSGRNGERFHTSYSAGIAEYPSDGDDLHTLYLAADRALAEARGRFCKPSSVQALADHPR